MMKKLIIFLMGIVSVNTFTGEILKEKEKIEPPMTTQIICGFPPCDITEGKCVIPGFKVDGEKMNEAESYDLKYIANMLNTYMEKGSLEIIGHTDSYCSKKNNLKLSFIRARNVAKLLREYGLDKRFSIEKIIGKGGERPMDTNETVEGRYNNRRIEIILNNLEYKKTRFINE